ncbi:MAG: hypothetical protein CL878_03495 [Dehalococcoidia bacterium]|nr:hypothetical protein [Dehalococcoidia bacterium]
MAGLLARPPTGGVALRWLGQGGFVFRSPGDVTWAVDPYLTDYSTSRGRIDRLTPPPIAASELPVEAVLSSHRHYDHLDPETLTAVASHTSASFYAAAEGASILTELDVDAQRVRTVAVGDTLTLGDPKRSDVRATIVFAEHGGDPVGFVFAVGRDSRAVRVYVSGDTLFNERLISPATQDADVLCVCINGRGGNMTYQDAVELTRRLAPSVVIPMHFAVMPHNTIDPELFVDAAQAAGLPAEIRVLAVGEATQFHRGRGGTALD